MTAGHGEVFGCGDARNKNWGVAGLVELPTQDDCIQGPSRQKRVSDTNKTSGNEQSGKSARHQDD